MFQNQAGKTIMDGIIVGGIVEISIKRRVKLNTEMK